jgi:hypothetical protein
VKVHDSTRRDGEDGSGNDLAVGDDHDEVGSETPQKLDRLRRADLRRLVNGDSAGERERLRPRHPELVAPPCGLVGLSDESQDGMARIEERLESRESECSRAHEQDLHS